MITIRWVRSSEGGRSANMKDEEYATKRAALEAIRREAVSSIRRLPTLGGKLYAVTVKR